MSQQCCEPGAELQTFEEGAACSFTENGLSCQGKGQGPLHWRPHSSVWSVEASPRGGNCEGQWKGWCLCASSGWKFHLEHQVGATWPSGVALEHTWEACCQAGAGSCPWVCAGDPEGKVWPVRPVSLRSWREFARKTPFISQGLIS